MSELTRHTALFWKSKTTSTRNRIRITILTLQSPLQQPSHLPSRAVIATPSSHMHLRRANLRKKSMDEDTLTTLAELLAGSQSPQVRTAAATAVAASTSGDANAQTRSAIGRNAPLLRRLLALRGDAAAGRFALSALVNLAEDEGAARALIALRAVATATSALLDTEQREFAVLYTGLLANLTRLPEGVDALTGAAGRFDAAERRRAEANLLRMAESLLWLPNGLFIANACSSKRGREVLLSASHEDPRKQPLNAVLKLLSNEDKDKRLAAASALRNCALAEESHEALVQRTDVLGVALVRLMSPSRPLSEEDLDGAPKEVVDAAAKPLLLKAEPFAEIRLMIVEALLLLCQTHVGREALRKCRAYPVLREWHLEEDDGVVREAVEQIVDRTELLKEVGDGDSAPAPINDIDIPAGDESNGMANDSVEDMIETIDASIK